MPVLTSADLLPLLEGDPAELEGRLCRLLGSLGRDLAEADALLEPVLELRRRAALAQPSPTREELGLGLLSLLANQERGR